MDCQAAMRNWICDAGVSNNYGFIIQYPVACYNGKISTIEADNVQTVW